MCAIAHHVAAHAQGRISALPRPAFGRREQCRADSAAAHPRVNHQSGEFRVCCVLELYARYDVGPADHAAARIFGNQYLAGCDLTDPVQPRCDRLLVGRITELTGQLGELSRIVAPGCADANRAGARYLNSIRDRHDATSRR